MNSGIGAISLIADVAVFAVGRVLLVRYADVNAYDHQRGWFLPDDALRHLEHPRDGAVRILAEQLGLVEVTPTLDHIESFTGKDRSWHLVFHFRIDLSVEPNLVPSSDLAEFAWFALDALPERRDVAHGGWALGTLRTMTAEQITV